MKLLVFPGALALALSVSAAVGAEASVGSSEIPAVYATLLDTMIPPENQEVSIRRAHDEEMPAAILAQTEMAKLEGDCPGLVSAMMQGAEPVLREQRVENATMERNRLASIVSAHLSIDE